MLFAKNEEANKWLSEHPAVLGGGALLIGLILVGVGIPAIISGKATGKYGHEMKGGMARTSGPARIKSPCFSGIISNNLN